VSGYFSWQPWNGHFVSFIFAETPIPVYEFWREKSFTLEMDPALGWSGMTGPSRSDYGR
jgi:hypothetical protein